jgi:thiol-disulfide isomerase/thioredoxin
LLSASGKKCALEDFEDAKALLVMFLSNRCPFVKHIRHELAMLVKEYQPKGLGVVGINANDVAAYPDEILEKMAEEVRNAGYSFPYLRDETQEVAKAYKAACTPDFFLFDRERKLTYRGQFDDSRPGNGKPVTGKDLRAALNEVLAGRPANVKQVSSIGCNIKWKPGNEPDYFHPGRAGAHGERAMAHGKMHHGDAAMPAPRQGKWRLSLAAHGNLRATTFSKEPERRFDRKFAAAGRKAR